MTAAAYLYELRRGDTVLATGHLSGQPTPEVGETLRLAGTVATVREVLQLPGGVRVILEAEDGRAA